MHDDGQLLINSDYILIATGGAFVTVGLLCLAALWWECSDRGHCCSVDIETAGRCNIEDATVMHAMQEEEDEWRSEDDGLVFYSYHNYCDDYYDDYYDVATTTR